MSQTKVVKKLSSIDDTLLDIRDLLGGGTSGNSLKTIFNSHTKNTTQVEFEKFHETTNVTGGSVSYSNNPERGVEILSANPAAAESGAHILSYFRVPYVTQRVKVCFNHEVTVADDTSVIQTVLGLPNAVPTDDALANSGYGFLWGPTTTLSILYDSAAITSFNKDPLDGTGNSGINLTDDTGVFSTFIIFDIANLCIQYGKNVMVKM